MEKNFVAGDKVLQAMVMVLFLFVYQRLEYFALFYRAVHQNPSA